MAFQTMTPYGAAWDQPTTVNKVGSRGRIASTKDQVIMGNDGVPDGSHGQLVHDLNGLSCGTKAD